MRLIQNILPDRHCVCVCPTFYRRNLAHAAHLAHYARAQVETHLVHRFCARDLATATTNNNKSGALCFALICQQHKTQRDTHRATFARHHGSMTIEVVSISNLYKMILFALPSSTKSSQLQAL